jgi:Glycosyl hydrolase family 9
MTARSSAFRFNGLSAVQRLGTGLLVVAMWAGSTGTNTVWAAAILRQNVLGTHPQGPKQVWVAGASDPQGLPLRPIIVNPSQMGKVLTWQAKTVATPTRLPTDEAGWMTLDYSALNQSGLFSLRFKSVAQEPALEKALRVNEFVYWDLLTTSVRALVLARSGIAINDPVTGIALDPGHLQTVNPHLAPNPQVGKRMTASPTADAAAIAGSARLLPGGWYDGVSYDRHLPDIALTSARMLALYELNPTIFKTLRLSYPQLSRQVGTPTTTPDLLKEASWGLQWLLTVQEADGGFIQSIKTLGTQAPEPTLPAGDTRLQTYEAPTLKGTAQAVAVLAMASQTLKDSDLPNAVQYLLAAEKGWRWLAANQSTLRATSAVPELEQVKTLLYQGWAALNLYRATGQLAYWQKAQRYFASVTELAWEQALLADPGLLVVAQSVVEAAQSPWMPPLAESDPGLPSALLTQIIHTRANQVMEEQQEHPYHLATEQAWLPSAQVVADAQWLVLAYLYPSESVTAALQDPTTGQVDKQLAKRLLAQKRGPRVHASLLVDYLMGLNPWDQPFITGQQSVSKVKTLEHPCHPYQRAARFVVPGLLVNGPTEAYPKDVPFQDNAFACESTGTPLALNSQFMWLMGLMNQAYQPDPLTSAEEAKARKEPFAGTTITAPSNQSLPDIR